MNKFYQQTLAYFRKVNIILLVFLLLVLNVKLVVKLAVLLLISLWHIRSFSFKNLVRQQYLYFYAAMIAIAVINLLLQITSINLNYFLTFSLGLTFWIMAAIASYHLFLSVQKIPTDILHRTVTVFFLLHIAATFIDLFLIMIETGSLNPYTYKGLNQKYYISTGDFISGISFDSPVTTALISGFALIYFLYNRKYLLSLLATASLLIIGSNLTNLLVIGVLLLTFLFDSSRIQKSIITIQCCMLIVFVAKISPQNNEYIGRFAFKLIDKPYDLPKKNTSISFIKIQPDSILSAEDQKKKRAQLFLDSTNAEKSTRQTASAATSGVDTVTTVQPRNTNTDFTTYRETADIKGRINRYKQFLEEYYTTTEIDSLQRAYNWKLPGKWIAMKQLIHFFNDHPQRFMTGTGIGNFASRTAFKVTSLQIAGGYPDRFRYIHPWFRNNHLFLYTYYHSQSQPKHAAENTPDSTYGQILAEYGILGLLSFLVLYAGYFLKRARQMSYGLPVLILLLSALFVEYWFEQLSIVILAELLLFMDLKKSSTTTTEQ